MAKELDIRNKGKALMEILHARVQNSGWSLYSICCSPSGCCPSREAIAPQGTAVGENLLQPFRLSWNSSSTTQGAAIEHYLSQHSVLYSNAASLGGRQSLKGSDRYCRWHSHWLMVRPVTIQSLKGSDRCCSPSGCGSSREAIAPQGAARGENLLQPFRLLGNSSSTAQGAAIGHYVSGHFVPHSNAASLGGRQSLKGSDRYCRWHSHWLMVRSVTIQSLKGSNKHTLRHRRRMLPIAFSSMSLKGSDRCYLRHRRRMTVPATSSLSLKGSDKYELIHSSKI